MKHRKIKNAVFIASTIIGVLSAVLVGARAQVGEWQEKKTVMMSTIAFASTHHDPTANLFASKI